MPDAGAGLSLEEIVRRLGGVLTGDPAVRILRVATLERAGPGDVAFLANPRYRSQLGACRAGAVIARPADADGFAGNRIVTDNPHAYFARLASLLNPPPVWPAGIHTSAVVEAQIPGSASIGPHAYIGPGAVLGERVVVQAGTSVGEGASIGEDSVLHPNVVVYPRCVIGRRAIVHSGAIIGADGFGFAREAGGAWTKVPQLGRVVIGDDVEIGAGTTIDRGALEDTVIEDGVKLDNQIQIAHNVRVGAHTVMAGCVGVAGSARIGRRCAIGGAAMILGHLSLADDVQVSAGTLIAKSIREAGVYSGTVPSLPHGEWLRHFAHLRRLDDLADRIRALEKRLSEAEDTE